MEKKQSEKSSRWLLIFLAATLVFIILCATKVICVRHEWQPATITEPETCSRCGKTRGEPLGSTVVTSIFGGINPLASSSESSSDIAAVTEVLNKPYKGTVALKLSAHGFGSVGDALDYLTFALGVDTEAKAVDLNVSLFGRGVDFIFAWDNDSPRFSVPSVSRTVYGFGSGLMEELTRTGLVTEVSEESDAAEAAADQAWTQKLTDLILSYAKPENITDEAGTYAFSLLGGTVEGHRFTLKLDKAQWKDFLRQFTDLLKEKASFMSELIDKYGSADGLFNISDSDADEAAEGLKDVSLTFFYDGGRVYALSLGTVESGFVYESEGKATESGRRDAIGILSDGTVTTLAQNTLTKKDKSVTGTLKLADVILVQYSAEEFDDGSAKLFLDISYENKGLSAEATYQPGKVNIAVPGAPDRVINSQDELAEVIGDTVEGAVSSMIGF